MYSLKLIYLEIKQSLNLSIPLIAAQLIYGISNFVSTMMVAHVGPKELAANSLGWSIFVTITMFFIGTLSASGIFVAQSFGAKDINGVKTATNQGFILAIIFGLPMIILCWLAPLFLPLFGQVWRTHLWLSWNWIWICCFVYINDFNYRYLSLLGKINSEIFYIEGFLQNQCQIFIRNYSCRRPNERHVLC